jgi:L-threonylcarbamoyladenylate synthase
MTVLGPAPLTYVVKKSAQIPDAVTAGLDTVAVRIPAHPSALAFIGECGVPIAAPSANISGRPSPTAAAHVLADLNGKIPLILDGGACGFGVESTVVDFTGDTPLILRPGGFSKERLEGLLGQEVEVYKKPEKDEPARSPGLKHAHYAPRCKIEAVPNTDVIKKLKKAYDNHVQKGEKPVILCIDIYSRELGGRGFVSLGSGADDAARLLFSLLRENEDRFDVIICHYLPDEGLGRAYNDRLGRAAGVMI